MRLLDRQRAYAAHDDPAAAVANVIALVIAWNGPFYPLYVIVLIGWAGLPSLLTMLATPVFAAVPWLMRRSSAAGRAALPLIGAANTLWCVKLMGPPSGVILFLMPCLVLAALLFRRGERWLMLSVLGLSLAALFVPIGAQGAIMALSSTEAGQLAELNLVSVGMLMALLALQLANVLARSERSG